LTSLAPAAGVTDSTWSGPAGNWFCWITDAAWPGCDPGSVVSRRGDYDDRDACHQDQHRTAGGQGRAAPSPQSRPSLFGCSGSVGGQHRLLLTEPSGARHGAVPSPGISQLDTEEMAEYTGPGLCMGADAGRLRTHRRDGLIGAADCRYGAAAWCATTILAISTAGTATMMARPTGDWDQAHTAILHGQHEANLKRLRTSCRVIRRDP
jgi:hypothetical protein